MTRKHVPTRLVVRIDLRGIAPPIWRRLEIDPDLTLDQVHGVIQAAFDWNSSHLHQFSTLEPGRRWGGDRFVDASLLEDDMFGRGEVFGMFGGNDLFGMVGQDIDESTVQVGSLLVKPKDALDYQYDFGDSWDHRIRLEKSRIARLDEPAVVCTAGRRAAPPDDCGGIWRYQYLVEAGMDTSHPDYGEVREQLDWIFGENVTLDPEAFDLERINRKLAAAADNGFQAW